MEQSRTAPAAANRLPGQIDQVPAKKADQRYLGPASGQRPAGGGCKRYFLQDAGKICHRDSRKLEQDLEDAIAGMAARLGLRKLPLLPSRQTVHLMAKAAVAVYESAVENQREPE